MDITNKDLSMRPQYGIVGKESRDRVDYAIKEAEDLICITEDRQHKVPLGFAQNIKQLQSACETNKRKRKRSDDDFDYLYGIITMGRDWHFLLYSPEKYPSVKEVLGIIVALLKDRACVEDEPDRKRVRIEGYHSKNNRVY
ncbi:hypothetical protein RhiirC2_855023 [Rhizophagus irregularis]|uniref:Uncharacterized protein n=1 Tax=Rhizophagus irregularis TaxID=588596 RepID=A0A2N1MP77_9GLOM|nr:hypothetical protein RhiirC2_855023 [Rhizophagus irregularis]